MGIDNEKKFIREKGIVHPKVRSDIEKLFLDKCGELINLFDESEINYDIDLDEDYRVSSSKLIKRIGLDYDKVLVRKEDGEIKKCYGVYEDDEFAFLDRYVDNDYKKLVIDYINECNNKLNDRYEKVYKKVMEKDKELV